MKKFGIDVSTFQGNIDWKRVKNAGVEFVIIRAGYGRELSQKDARFEEYYKGCKSNNIPCGCYWYSYAKSAEEAIKEANTCYEIIKGKQFEYPIYFDIEDRCQTSLGRDTISAITTAFCNRLEELGYWVGVYSFTSFLNSNMTDKVKNDYAIWVAHTGVDKPSYTSQYGMWQYTHNGSVDGISGNVDCNYCYIDYPTLIAKAGKNNISSKPSNDNKDNNSNKPKNIEIILDGVKYSGTVTEVK